MLSEPAAAKIFDLLLCAEMAYQWLGVPYRTFLIKHRRKYKGAVQRQIDKIIKAKDIERFMLVFMEEF